MEIDLYQLSPHLAGTANFTMISVMFVAFIIALASNTRQVGADLTILGIPTVGVRKEWFAWSRATFRSIMGTRASTSRGYSKYSVFNLPFVLPNLDRGPTIIIPPKHVRAVYSLPETQLDVWNTLNNLIQPRYTIQDYHILGRELHLDVLRNQITRNLGILTKGLAAELDRGLKTWWGTDSQWKNIRAFDSCLKIVGAAANSVIFGPSLCRNHRFIYLLSVHAIILFIGGTLINVSPRLLKPIVGFPVKVASRYYYNQILGLCLPLVQDRLNKTIAWRDGLTDEWSPPSDGLQWMIEEAFTKTDPTELDVKRLSERLIFLNDVSMHTSAFTLQSLLQRLAASDPRDEYIEILRNEARTVLSKFNGEWTREGVQNLVLLDSTIRESIRLSPFVIFGLPRTVVDPNGVLVKAHGSEYTLPFGGSIALPIEDTHYDEQVYPNAKTFQPFRFVHLDDGVTPIKSTGTLRLKKTAVTLDEHFYGFGYGKHGCPGRFFVVHEIKLIMANILLNYDIKHIQSPTEPFNIMWLKLPINDPILQIRRRVSGTESREGI